MGSHVSFSAQSANTLVVPYQDDTAQVCSSEIDSLPDCWQAFVDESTALQQVGLYSEAQESATTTMFAPDSLTALEAPLTANPFVGQRSSSAIVLPGSTEPLIGCFGDVDMTGRWAFGLDLDGSNPLEEDFRYCCAQCGIRFDTSIKLEKHAKETMHKAYICDALGCGRKYRRRDCYVRHAATHRSNDLHVCRHCESSNEKKTFKRKDHLLQHEKTCQRNPARRPPSSAQRRNLRTARSSSNLQYRYQYQTIEEIAGHLKGAFSDDQVALSKLINQLQGLEKEKLAIERADSAVCTRAPSPELLGVTPDCTECPEL